MYIYICIYIYIYIPHIYIYIYIDRYTHINRNWNMIIHIIMNITITMNITMNININIYICIHIYIYIYGGGPPCPTGRPAMPAWLARARSGGGLNGWWIIGGSHQLGGCFVAGNVLLPLRCWSYNLSCRVGVPKLVQKHMYHSFFWKATMGNDSKCTKGSGRGLIGVWQAIPLFVCQLQCL